MGAGSADIGSFIQVAENVLKDEKFKQIVCTLGQLGVMWLAQWIFILMLSLCVQPKTWKKGIKPFWVGGGLGGGPMRYEEELAVLHEAAWKLLFHSVFWAGRSWWNSQCALLRRECSILQEMEPLTVHVGKTLGHYSMRPGVSVGKQSALCRFNCWLYRKAKVVFCRDAARARASHHCSING